MANFDNTFIVEIIQRLRIGRTYDSKIADQLHMRSKIMKKFFAQSAAESNQNRSYWPDHDKWHEGAIDEYESLDNGAATQVLPDQAVPGQMTLASFIYDYILEIVRVSYVSDMKQAKSVVVQCAKDWFVEDSLISHLRKSSFEEGLKFILQYAKMEGEIEAKRRRKNQEAIWKERCNTPDLKYFVQYLYEAGDEENIVFHLASPDFASLRAHNRIFVVGGGGLGKSTFLVHLERGVQGAKEFQKVFRYNLASLVKNAAHFNENVITAEMLKSGEALQNEYSYLVLLDGYNEVVLEGPQTVAAVLKAIEEISGLYQNSTIVVTCRTESEKAFMLPEELRQFEVFRLSSVPKDDVARFLNDHQDFPKTLKGLLSLPLYFNYIEGAEQMPQNRYELLGGIYKKLFQQERCGNSAFFVFYCLSPWIIHITSKTGGSNFVSEQELEEIETALFNNKPLCKALFHAAKELTSGLLGDLGYVFADIDFTVVRRILRANCGPFSRSGSNQFAIFHEDIRYYLHSLSELIVLKAIQTCWADAADNKGQALVALKDLSLECGGLSAISTEMLVTELGLSDSANAALGVMYSDLLWRRRLFVDEALVLYSHSIFVLSDFLGLGRERTEASVDKIIGKVVEALQVAVDEKRLNFAEPFKSRCEAAIGDMLAKLAEVKRCNGDYVAVLQLVALAKRISSDKQILGGITNQEAKVYLNMYEDICKGVALPDGLPDYTGQEEILFEKGIALLEQNAAIGYNVSCALLGLLLTQPTMYLLDRGKKIDLVTGFFFYLKAVLENQKWNRKISYCSRKAIILLLTGQVRTKFRFYDFNDLKGCSPDDFEEGEKNPWKVDENTFHLVSLLLENVHGQESPGLGYARAMVAYKMGESADRVRMWLESENRLLNKIAINKMYELEDKYDLKKAYESLKKEILDDVDGEMDNTHPIYTYIQAKNLELGQAKPSIDFSEFEKNFPDVLKGVIARLS